MSACYGCGGEYGRAANKYSQILEVSCGGTVQVLRQEQHDEVSS